MGGLDSLIVHVASVLTQPCFFNSHTSNSSRGSWKGLKGLSRLEANDSGAGPVKTLTEPDSTPDQSSLHLPSTSLQPKATVIALLSFTALCDLAFLPT